MTPEAADNPKRRRWVTFEMLESQIHFHYRRP